MIINNPVSKQIWGDRYKKNNETLDENIKRVAKFCSNNQNEYNMFYDVMNQGLFFPAGRTMSNAGIGDRLTLNNCFTLNSVPDDMSGIFDMVKIGALTHKGGGGTGYDFSAIRPKGMKTSNDAIASGAISFMSVFDKETETIQQGSRRGANMGCMNIYHYDIVDFINAKANSANAFEHFNLSVMVDDDFMKAKNNNENIYLRWPVYDERGKIIKDKNKWKIYKEINANELWNLIIRKAYDTGEPGVLFYDNMNKNNNTYYMENILGTNPCFTGDMKLLTSEGYKTFKELENSNFNIVNADGDISKGIVWCSGVKETIELTLSNKQKIRCTPNHVFKMNDNTECEAQYTKGKRLKLYCGKTNTENDLFVKLGFIQGDGDLNRLNSKYHKGLEINIGKNDGDIYDLFQIKPKENARSYYVTDYYDILIKYGFDGSTLPERVFPITYTSWSNDQKLNFLKGCYSANGSIITNYRISYKTTSKVFAHQLKKALEEYSIDSYITTNKPKTVTFKNGDYKCRESYDINIDKYESVITFYQLIGFVQKYKNENLQKLIDVKSPMILNIKTVGKEKVYDFTEPLIHWGVVNGVIVHNCGEYISGMLYGDKIDNPNDYKGACNLGSVFVHRFVKNPFTDDVKIDWNSLKSTVKIAVRFLDNIIDKNYFPHESYKNYQKNMRTIGLGVTGLASLLAMYQCEYGSKEAIKLTDNLLGFIVINAYKESIELAKEKGSFPFLDKEKYVNSYFITKHIVQNSKWQNIKDDIIKYGIRNARLISIAPTGTLSLTYGENCSSGIEPIFSLEYKRKVKIGGQDEKDTQIIDMRDSSYQEWISLNKPKIKENTFKTALELPVQKHLDMLATIAFHADMSISKTINIPTEYPFEDTKKVYDFCWKNGIKGCTIFRPNELRQGILITENTKKEKQSEETEMPRGFIEEVPTDLNYRKYKLKTGCTKLYLFVGIDESEGRIYDIFTNTDGSSGCPINTQAVSRLLSAGIRGGVPIEYLIEQLEKAGVCPSFQYKRGKGEQLCAGKSCASAIGYVLKSILKEFDEDTNEKISEKTSLTQEDKDFISQHGAVSFAKKTNRCPECGSKINHIDGCISCTCGWSKCGE